MSLINGKTKTVALLGNPVEHSFSPLIHNYGFKAHDLNAIYLNHTVKKENLKSAIEGIKALNYIGANITYPHKTEVIKYLDELSQEAKFIGAVNTIKNEDGKLVGYNTDGLGFIYSMEKQGVDATNKTICILGAGGAAKSIAISLCLKINCQVIICSRDINKAYEIAKLTTDDFIGNIRPISTQELDLKEVDILINATPVGMKETQESIPFKDTLILNENLIVYDLIYNPLETKLLKQAKELGCSVYNGLDMLVGQGVLSFEIWMGKTLNFDRVKKIIQNNI